ncbi:beta-ketoacyl-[acyl-carrier-protein] synthase family protein [Streptomyces sp. NBC_00289]|uniref:beta-ketoacyl synthase N-terminal-like domain-containing protein n=1 Tax=Streptomyces sp. NBC_00289 TaxID=2975703 RepID=UPI00324EFBD8
MPVAVTGMAVLSGFGRGTAPLLRGVSIGAPAFRSVRRFAVGSGSRTDLGAVHHDARSLPEELTSSVTEACAMAGLTKAERAATPLFLAIQADREVARQSAVDFRVHGARASAVEVAARCGLYPRRVYTNACTAASTALAEAASMIASGSTECAVVASGYLVDAERFALFSAGGALSDDQHVRPFSSGRRGLLLGDAVGAVVLEKAGRAGGRAQAALMSWALSGDAHHVCRPHPAGAGLARAITSALDRAGLDPQAIDYVNAHGTGTTHNDAAESAALHRALGSHSAHVAVSSSKSVHGHALEASGMLELITTVLALQSGQLPVNAGYLGADEQCGLNLVLSQSQAASDIRYALSLNAAFGGANTALVVGRA